MLFPLVIIRPIERSDKTKRKWRWRGKQVLSPFSILHNIMNMNIKIILKKFSSLNVSQHSQRWCKGKNLHIYIYSMLRLANIFFPINNSKTIKIDTKCHNTRFYVSRRLKYSRKGAWDGCERAHQRIAADANQQSTSVTKSESYPSRGSVPHCSPKKEREMNTFWKLPLYFAFILDSLYFCFLPVAAQFFYNFLLLLV